MRRLFETGHYNLAFEQLQNTLELDPNFVFAHILLAHVYASKGMFKDSLSTCDKVTSLHRDSPCGGALQSVILAMSGRIDEAKNILIELKRQPGLDPLSLISLASADSILGEKDEAFELLEIAYQERASFLIFLGIYPTFNNLRSDPRFPELLRRIRLPQ